MDIPGMRWEQELGRVRTALALAPQLRAKFPTSPISFHLFPACSLVAHSDLGSLPSAELPSSSSFCALKSGDGVGDPECTWPGSDLLHTRCPSGFGDWHPPCSLQGLGTTTP